MAARSSAWKALCFTLGGVALALFVVAAWLLIGGSALLATLYAGVAGFAGTAAWGLYHLRRWGVILFGGLCAVGAINHLVSVIFSFPDLTSAPGWQIAAELIRVAGAFLIPLALMYLTLLLWRQTA